MPPSKPPMEPPSEKFVNPVEALRSMPGVPKTSPEATLRNPSRNNLRSTTRAPSAEAATLPETPECTEKPASATPVPEYPFTADPPGSTRVRRESSEWDFPREPPITSRVPGYPAGRIPRMLPSPPRVPRGRAPRAPPGSSPSGPCPESPTPRDYPGHSAITPRVPGSVSFQPNF